MKTGNIDVGTAIISGGQIKFPATDNPSADVNTLDDYEEGTWTPGISFGGGSIGITYTTQAGKYTKIGRQVTVMGYMLLTSKGSSVGEAVITGLPFKIYNESGNYSVPNLWLGNISFVGQYKGYGPIDTYIIKLQQTTTAGISSNLTDTNFANNSLLIVQLTYFVS